MKHIISLIFAVLLSLVYAHAVEIDGICYYISGDEAIVTLKNLSDYDYEPSYFGEVVIPSSITYEGKTYSVTSIGESAFIDCTRLTSVTIPGSFNSTIGSPTLNAYLNMEGLEGSGSLRIQVMASWLAPYHVIISGYPEITYYIPIQYRV